MSAGGQCEPIVIIQIMVHAVVAISAKCVALFYLGADSG